jgi:KDO2-lipid IV(A) lauroyltransferase
MEYMSLQHNRSVEHSSHSREIEKGPEKGAKLNNTAQVFVHFYRTKRGYYHSEYEIMTTEPNQFEEGQLTLQFVKLLEEKIKLNPSNYLWSHRRWKYNYDAAIHEKLYVK